MDLQKHKTQKCAVKNFIKALRKTKRHYELNTRRIFYMGNVQVLRHAIFRDFFTPPLLPVTHRHAVGTSLPFVTSHTKLDPQKNTVFRI